MLHALVDDNGITQSPLRLTPLTELNTGHSGENP